MDITVKVLAVVDLLLYFKVILQNIVTKTKLNLPQIR